jgi:hypothetical protein
MSEVDLLVWDCSTCPSKTISFLSQLQTMRRSVFTSIFVVAVHPNQIPASLGDASVAFPITTRLGPYAIHDAVVDVLGSLTQSQGYCSLTLISANLALWFAIFQRLPPKTLLIVSSADPYGSLEFTFLPQSIPIRTLSWPNLEDSSPASELQQQTFDEMTEIVDGSQSEPSEGTDEHIKPASRNTIQPLDDLDDHEFDMRSPLASKEVVKPPAQKTTTQKVQVQLKFKPLVEVMKSFGKAMVSLADLDRELKNWFTEYGGLSENTTTYIAKAADAQIVVVDKAINYVRFRNRNLAKSQIEYV